MEIRELKAKDLKTLAKMLGKLQPSSIAGILGAVGKSGKKAPGAMEVGLSLFRIVAADLTDDIYNWLADLIGKTPAELDEMPMDTPVEIVKALVKKEDFSSFFEQASRLAEIQKASRATTTQSSSDTAGRTK